MKALYLTAALAALTAPALAQTATSPADQSATTTSPAQMSNLDAPTFVKMAGVGNIFEIQTSQFAEKKSKNTDVKQFASEMIKDHTKAQRDLETLVKSENNAKLQVPTRLDAEHEQKVKQLQAASGAEFDRSYKQMQIDAHQQAVSLFQAYSQQGDDPKLKTWAQNMLPTLQQHLSRAQSIRLNEQTGSLRQ